jgi:hypothetical protein
MLTTPFGWVGAEPVMSIFACSVPVTLVSAVVTPWMRPRSIGVLSMCTSIWSAFATVAPCAASRSAIAPLLNSVAGRYPLAVMNVVGFCCSRASTVRPGPL